MRSLPAREASEFPSHRARRAAILLPWLLFQLSLGTGGLGKQSFHLLNLIKGAAAPVRAGVDEWSHVSRGVCVVRFKTFILVGGAIVASSLSSPTQFGPASKAVAADGLRQAVEEAVTVPEFVPILNFSQFVLATEQFAEANRVTARGAAEALSAKFASASEGQRIELNQGPQETPPIVQSALGVAVSDPAAEKPAGPLADPVKIATVVPDASAAPPVEEKSQETEAKAADTKPVTAASRQGANKRFRPAMGLGMPAASDDEAALFSSTPQRSKKKSADRAASSKRIAAAGVAAIVNPANGPANGGVTEYKSAVPKEDFQIGIPGQTMEPLISNCAKTERTCFGKLCGC